MNEYKNLILKCVNLYNNFNPKVSLGKQMELHKLNDSLAIPFSY